MPARKLLLSSSGLKEGSKTALSPGQWCSVKSFSVYFSRLSLCTYALVLNCAFLHNINGEYGLDLAINNNDDYRGRRVLINHDI